ncbi:thioredoxin family protein [Avibacterium avium]|uniref:thioredoxin family protein n=1 Tax=Avibacterium TaxID=292486 RepID=UPI003BF8AFDF
MNTATNLAQIEQEIIDNPLVLLLIKAPNCGVCTSVAQQLVPLLADKPEIFAMQANIADIPEMASRFHALTAPVVLMFYQQKEVGRFARFVPIQELKERLAFWQNFAD